MKKAKISKIITTFETKRRSYRFQKDSESRSELVLERFQKTTEMHSGLLEYIFAIAGGRP